MSFKSVIIFSAFLLGSLAVPVPDENVDMSIFFENTIAERDASGRIVGGNVAANGAHPWMVAFTTGGASRNAHCGGSILTQRTVLTAAHCIVPVRVGNGINANVRLNVGTNVRNSGGQSLTASGSAVHPQYNGNTIKNDIGTLFTASNINYNSLVAPIVVSFNHVAGGVQSRVAGWGMTSSVAPASNQLLEIQVPTIGPQQCVQDVITASANLNIQAPPVDPNIEICTFLAVNRGTCRGDSGSPLVRIDNRQQIGIVSWGFPCARGAPDMYVRVSAFQSWVLANTI